jgi:hypothetical protein
MELSPKPRTSVFALAASIVACGSLVAAAASGPDRINNAAQASQPAQRVASPTPPTTPPPTSTSPGPVTWTKCADQYGGGCSYSPKFSGLREMRFGSPVTNQWVYGTFHASLGPASCGNSAFGIDYDVAPGQGKQCEYSSVYKTTTLPPPLMEMGPTVDRSQIPLGNPGYSAPKISNGQVANPAGDGVGAFRIICDYSHMNYDDAIVYPGQPGRAHLHTYFGNTAANASSTADSLLNSGSSTCFGGTANRSAYWVPTAVDTRSNSPKSPTIGLFYYKSGYGGVAPSAIQPMPAGLRMIAGEVTATTAAQASVHGGWSCGGASTASIPACPAGSELRLIIEFPQCWNGSDLDSANHRSHMAYSSNGCPSSHPIAIPVITFNIIWLVQPGDATDQWRLSSDMYTNGPGGYSFHGDWFNGWDAAIENEWINSCVRAARDCSNTLGNGRMLDS